MIEKLTEQQVQQLAVYRERWWEIGLATGPCNHQRVEQAIDELYQCAGLAPPRQKIWVKSPLAGCIAAAQLCQVRAQVWDQVRAQVRAQVGAQVRAQVRDQVWDQVWAQVWDQVWAQVGAQVWDQVRAQVGAQVGNCGYGTHDANWLAFYEYFWQECAINEVKRLSGLIQLAQAGCGWWWPFEGSVILSERPSRLMRDDEHRLHCENGAALQYPDGFAIYAWHGVRLDPWMIKEPERITPEVVLQKENQEIRRALLEIYGYPQFLADLQADKIHQDDYGVLYETKRLGEYLDGEDAVARFVQVVDPSTGRQYALRVPPDVATAHAGVAWTFEETVETYRPTQEA
jgi:hypothetical protein